MATYTYASIAVYAELGGALRLARGARVFTTDPTTGAPVDATQGARVAPYVDADASGDVSFTAESWPVRLTSGATYEDVWPIDAAGPADATVAGLVGAATATRTALDGRYVTDAEADATVAALIPAATATRAQLDARYATSAIVLPASNGTDDTAAINAVLTANAGRVVRGYPGATYVLSAPIVVCSGTTLDMTGCTITGNPVKNLLQNFAVTPSRSVTNGATTAGSTTVTSATAAFTSADVGKPLSVLGAGQNYGRADAPGSLYGTVVSVTSGTAVVLSSAATLTVTGKKLSVYPADDVDITITGGTWNMGNKDSMSQTLDGHGFLLRRVTGLHLSPTRMTSTGTWGFGGSYAISLGDVTDVEAHGTVYNCASAAIQTAGPSTRISIRDQFGFCGDDMIAFVGVDGQSQPGSLLGDVEGDTTNVSVIGIHSNGSWRALRLISGTGTNGVQRVLSGVHAHDITGTTINDVIHASNYAGTSVISGEITGVSATPGSGFARYASTATTASIIGMNHTQIGVATLTSPTTTMAVTATIPFGVTFAAIPTVMIATPINAAGIITSTYSVTTTTIDFQVRYKASGSVGSNVTAAWIAVGVLA